MKRFLLLAVLLLTVALLTLSAAAQRRRPPAAPAKGLPETDPPGQGPPIKFLQAVAGRHPRLFITAERLPRLRAFYNSPEAAPYRQALLNRLQQCKIPANRKTTDGWGQEVGLWSMPNLALAYVLTGDKQTFARCVEYMKWLDDINDDWSEGGDEKNSDHAASFTMVGAALMWDWLYNDLDPAFREKFRKDLWLHAREMYYLGHLGGNPGGGYWRGVPAYNHRWFRDWGLSLATLATTDGKPEEQWMLGEVAKEIKFMVDWLPADGSQHEGPSYGSSAGGLGMACQAFDECLGSHFLDNPFFKSLGQYGIQIAAPSLRESLYFSDNFTRTSSIHPFFLKTAAYYKQPDVMDGIRHFLIGGPRGGGAGGDMAWLDLIEEDPSIRGGSYSRLPTTIFMPDLGITVVRDSWQDQAVCAMFKCGPMGGYKANSWRLTKREGGGLPYLNVAHDQPDANSFILLADGQYLAETDRYPEQPGKLSTGHNTILVNGLGQVVDGRPEGDEWQQPGNGDMTKMAVVTAYKDAGAVVVSEGEAAGSYIAYSDRKTGKSRPALQRFRRTVIWVKGSYLLVLDDVRSPQSVDITWLMQAAKLQTVDEAKGQYGLSKGGVSCGFQLVADQPFKTQMGVSTANDHSKPLNWQQLQATTHTAAVRFASLYDPWHLRNLSVKLEPNGQNAATVTVTGGNFEDTWQWQASPGRFEASKLHGLRNGGFDVTIDARSAAPPPPLPPAQ